MFTRSRLWMPVQKISRGRSSLLRKHPQSSEDYSREPPLKGKKKLFELSTLASCEIKIDGLALRAGRIQR